MSTTFIVICVFASVGALCVIIYYAHKVDQLTTDNEILKRRNKTLEERFSQEDEHASEEHPTVLSGQQTTGVEILQTFANTHQIKLEIQYDYENEAYELYKFMYQGGWFYCYAGKQTDEVLLRYGYFKELPCNEDMYMQILRLCDDFTSSRKYGKLTYTIDNDDPENKKIDLHLYIELIGVPQKGLEYVMNETFVWAREVCDAADRICKELAEGNAASDDKTIAYNDVDSMRDILHWMTEGKGDSN